jgi:hypothetical protein
LTGKRVDRDLIGAREQHVLDVGDHAARSRPVARQGAVHDREDAAVDLPLDHQQIDERLMDHRMGPVTALVEQAAEGVLHRSRGRREDVGLVIAPVVVVKTWVLTVGRWMMFSPTKRFGMWKPPG